MSTTASSKKFKTPDSTPLRRSQRSASRHSESRRSESSGLTPARTTVKRSLSDIARDNDEVGSQASKKSKSAKEKESEAIDLILQMLFKLSRANDSQEMTLEQIISHFTAMQNKGQNQKYLQCSRLTVQMLSDMGILSLLISRSSIPSEAKARELQNQHHMVIIDSLKRTLQYAWHFSVHNEAGRRIMVNDVLLTAAIIREKNTGKNGQKHQIIIYPEASLTPDKLLQPESSPTIERDGVKFFLSGVSDYLLVTLPASNDYQRVDDVKTGPKWFEADWALKEKCVVVEVKTQDEPSAPKAIAPAVGQALLFAKMTGLHVVRFIIVGGTFWTFGVLRGKRTGTEWRYGIVSGLSFDPTSGLSQDPQTREAEFAQLIEKVRKLKENPHDGNENQQKLPLELLLEREATLLSYVTEWIWPEHGDRMFDLSSELKREYYYLDDDGKEV